MAMTERSVKPGKVLKLVTEVDDASVNSRKRLKGTFLEKDKQQMRDYIKDLEKTLALNKEIISELLSAESSSATHKNTITKLNKENCELQKKVKDLIKERDNVQSRLLVCEQMIEEFKCHENGLEQQYEEKAREMLEQLSMKEYVVQSYEKRLRMALNLLMKYKEIDANVNFFLKEMSINGNEKLTMKNVVEENESLIKIMKELHMKLDNFERELFSLATQKTKELPFSDGPNSKLQMKFGRQELNKVCTYAKGITELVTKLRKDKLILEHNFMKMKITNDNMNTLNKRLSKSLFAATDELRQLKAKTKLPHTIKPAIKKARRNSQTQEKTGLKEEVSFSDISSIVADHKENEFFSYCQDINYEY
eukprot:TRINITY_DN8282_c0_g1_i1.p1 TRINITY_DN8282_c0_g1~~TRINITY_DN8282_c0_g1_i1.p1  ORF type:complete len:365 (+),score=89.14 TRINITY_DN8282_c0_g1_i1:183-1277(+)